jgi:hypothetical protein
LINSRLKKTVAKLTLDKQTLKKGARGKLLGWASTLRQGGYVGDSFDDVAQTGFGIGAV